MQIDGFRNELSSFSVFINFLQSNLLLLIIGLAYISQQQGNMQHSDILAIAGLRIDGRRYDELRNINWKIGVEAGADGSVYMEQGLNKILVSVFGPQEQRSRTNDISGDKVIEMISGLYRVVRITFIGLSVMPHCVSSICRG